VPAALSPPEKRCSVGRDDNEFPAILKAMMAQLQQQRQQRQQR
jgi:hypothetical protein